MPDTPESHRLTDTQLNDLDMAAAVGDFGTTGDEIVSLTDELRELRKMKTRLETWVSQLKAMRGRLNHIIADELTKRMNDT